MGKQQSALASLGIEKPEVGHAYFKPDGREREIDVIHARAPDADLDGVKPGKKGRLVKEVQNGTLEGQTIPLFAVLIVNVDGVPHKWEVSSARLCDILHDVLPVIPARIAVKTTGSGINKTFAVRFIKALEEPQPAPGLDAEE